MTDVDENEIEKEIVPFLLPTSRPDLRAIAVRYFLGLTGTEEGRQFIGSKPRYVQLIAALIDDEHRNIANDASMTIVNLAGDRDVLSMLPDPKIVGRLLLSALHESAIDASVAAMALANLSRSEQSAQRIVELMQKEVEPDVSIYRLVEVICRDDSRKLEHLASFLSNLTQLLEVRKILLSKDRCVLQRILPFISCNKSLIKRGGAVGTIRNCCFETDSHAWLLSDSVDILPRLLLPLAGPEEFDDDDMEKLPLDLQYLEPTKQREPDADIRRMLVESINQLCALKSCRQIIKDKNAYVILRELHKWETDESNLVALENLVSVLISDEPEAGMENLNEVEIPEHVFAKLTTATENHEQGSIAK